MAQFGSNRSVFSSNQSLVTDPNGNQIVSPDNTWQGSPLGVAARNQVAIGVPNGTFNLLPSNPVSAITVGNELPYWDLYADTGITASMEYDLTAQTWSVAIDPTAVGTALGTAVLRTRIPITNDDGLDVRHYVASSLVQAVKVAGTDKWTAKLTSQYYDVTGSAIGTAYTIGTIGERGTATVLGSYTNASGPISTSAAELELAYTLTVGTASPTYYLQVKSVMVATEFGVIGGGASGTAYIPLSTIVDKGDLILGTGAGAVTRLLSTGIQGQVLMQGTATNYVQWGTPSLVTNLQVFNSNGTFTVPTGVNYVTVVALPGGQGGGGGANAIGRISAQNANSGVGGASGYYALARDIYVGNVSTVSVGIGAGGSGGTAFVFNKAAGVSTTDNNNASTGSSGGDTTFGAYLTVPGARTAPTGFFDTASAAGAGNASAAGTTGGAGGVGGTHTIGATFSGAPFLSFYAGGVAGSTATGSGGTGANGAGGIAGTALAIAGGGGSGGGGAANATTGPVATAGAGGVGGPGGGASGGGGAARYSTVTATLVATAGAGGAAAANSGAGGGGGGACAVSYLGTAQYVPSTITSTSGAGGAGGSGRLIVIWNSGTVTP